MTAVSSPIVDKIKTAFPFSVDKFPLYGPEGLTTPHYGMFRSDTGESVGIACKRGYEPHTTDDVLALAEAAMGGFPGESDVACHWHDGHFVTVSPSREHRKAIYGTEDNIFPRFVVRARYDGRAFAAQLGYYRDACRNLAMLRSTGQEVLAHIRHTHQLRERMDELTLAFQRLAAGWDGVVATARQMEERRVNLASFLREVYPEPEDASRRTQASYDRRIERICRRLERERLRTGRPGFSWSRNLEVSAWEAFNAVQGYVQHDMPRKGRPDPDRRALIALDDQAVARAMEIALAA